MATNVRVLNSSEKGFLRAVAVGTGAIVAADELVTDHNKFPVGSQYTDLTNKVQYTKMAASTPGVVGDWYKTGALTQHS